MLQDEQNVGNEETDFRIKNLLPWQNILSNRQIAEDIGEKCVNQGDFVEESVLFTFPHQTNGDHVMEP